MRTICRNAMQTLPVLAVFILLASNSAKLLPAQQLLATNSLPEAPQVQESSPPQGAPKETATIKGTVSDIRGGLVPNAEIKLAEKDGKNVSQTVSDGEGDFVFADINPGSYTVEILSPGLETFRSPLIVLRPGERFELPDIALPIASATTTINVVMTQEEIATEELKLETQQRVLGVVPNFYTSFLWDAAPLNTKQKFKLSFRATTDPTVFIITGIVAGIEQAHNTFPEYGDGATGYGKRYGAAFGDAVIGRTLGSAVFPSIFRQDPRYFFMGPGNSTGARIKHAMLAGLIAKGDNGHWQPNYSHIFGNASAGAISTVYHPDSISPGQLALDNALIGIGGGAVQGLLREFVLSHITHKVPGYAKGKPAAATHP